MKNFIILLLLAISASSFAIKKSKPTLRELNFGILSYTTHYQIYRSAALGQYGFAYLMARLEMYGLDKPKTVIYMNDEGYGDFFGNYAVEEFQGQSRYGYKYYHSFGSDVRTYLDGHDPRNPKKDIDINSKLLSKEARYYFGQQTFNDGLDGDYQDFLNVLYLVLNPKNQPVLFHCTLGMHRTGMVALAVRYIQGVLTNIPPSDRSPIDGIVPLNEAEVEYSRYLDKWGFSARKENLQFIRWFATTPEFQALVQFYRSYL